MKSSNAAIKEAVGVKLVDIGYPVYSGYVPASEDGEAYILLSDITSNDASTMSTNDTETVLQIGIYTRVNIANSGDLCDQIAEGVYQRLYPDPQSEALDLEPYFQNCGVLRVSDRSATINLNSFIGMNRFITFTLLLYHR